MNMGALRALGTFRQPTRTGYDRKSAAAILLSALEGMQLPINGEQLRVAASILLAQSDYETAGWRSCWNHNWGNLRCKTDKPFTLIPGAVDENIDGEHVVAQGEDDPLRIFRAYATPEEGCRAWLDLLRDKYPWAWERLITAPDGEDAAAWFARALADPIKPRRYYTANRERYAAGLVNRYSACRKAVWE